MPERRDQLPAHGERAPPSSAQDSQPRTPQRREGRSRRSRAGRGRSSSSAPAADLGLRRSTAPLCGLDVGASTRLARRPPRVGRLVAASASGGAAGASGRLRLGLLPRLRLRARHRRDRQRLALQRHQRLRGHPDRRLVAGRRVGDAAVARAAGRAGRRARARAWRRPASDGHQSLNRVGGRLGVRVAAAELPEAAVVVLVGPQPGGGAPGHPRALAARPPRAPGGPRRSCRCRSTTRAPAPNPPSAFCAETSQATVLAARRHARRAQRQHAEGRVAHVARDRPVAAPPPQDQRRPGRGRRSRAATARPPSAAGRSARPRRCP